jgi:hypothetical protein
MAANVRAAAGWDERTNKPPHAGRCRVGQLAERHTLLAREQAAPELTGRDVYAKIGARGRTEATAFAITHGLAKA